MSARHTPGPWRHENRQTHYAIYHNRAPQNGHANRVAETIQWSPAESGRVTIAESEANARLIAAAPEGFGLIEQLEESFTADGAYGQFLPAMRAYLAKARGQ